MPSRGHLLDFSWTSVGLVKKAMRSYSLETGVGMMTSRGHLLDSRTNSALRAAGRPEQRSKPGSAPDLFSMKGEGSQAWPQHAHAWGLEVSRALTIHVTTKADSARLQKPWSDNFNPRSIGQNLQTLIWDVNPDSIVLETLDDEENFSLCILLDQLLTNGWQGDWLTIDQNLHGARGWNHLDLSDARPDLDNLLLGLNSPGGNSNWNVLGSVQKEDMLTVIDWVSDSHVVKGADVRWLNTAPVILCYSIV